MLKTMKKFSTDFFTGEDMEDLLEQFTNPLREHSRRVAVSVSIMAEHAEEFTYIYNLPRGISFFTAMYLGGMCHDVGKLVLPSLPQDKTDYTFHPQAGESLLEKHKNTLFTNEEQADIVLDIVRYHHECANGKGFPYKVKEKDIPFPAGVCALANWLDNRVNNKKGFDYNNLIKAFNMVSRLSGRYFCESAVKCFERAKSRLFEQYINWSKHVL